MANTDAITYQNIPSNKLQGKSLTNWSAPDIWVLSVSILIVIAALVWTHPLLSLTLTFSLGALNYRFSDGFGRNYDELIAGVRGWCIVTILGGVLWEANDTSRSFVGFLRRSSVILGRKKPIPLSFVRVQATIDEETVRFSLIRQLDRPYDHMLIAADGGAFANLDINQQQHAVDTLAELTNTTIAQSDLKVGFSYLRMNGPFDPTRIVGYLRSNMDPVIAHFNKFALEPETRDWAERMLRNANYLRPVATKFGGAETWYLIVLTIKRGKEWDQAQRGKLSSKQLYELPIVELGRSMIESLESSSILKLANVRCLSLAELATVVRCSWDVTGINDYYQRRAAGEIPRTDEEIDEMLEKHGEAYVSEALRALPERRIEISREGSYARFDDNYIATLRVTRLPQQTTAAKFMSLHYLAPGRGWTRQAMVGQSVSGDTETTQFILGESALINWHNATRGKRIVSDPRYVRQRQALSQQAQQVSAHSVSQHFNFLHVVVASSPSELRLQWKQRRAALIASGFQAEIVTPTYRILDAAISGMLGINRL